MAFPTTIEIPSKAFHRENFSSSISSNIFGTRGMPLLVRETVDSNGVQISSSDDQQVRPVATLKKELNGVFTGVFRWLYLVATLGISCYFYEKWRFVLNNPDGLGVDSGYSLSENQLLIPLFQDNTFLAVGRWQQVLWKLRKAWKLSRLGCALILPLSISLLQIDSVREGSISRTVAISAFICSVAGLILSVVLVSISDEFMSKKCRDEWIKASEGLKTQESIQFWSLLAFPLSLLIWSTIFCTITVFILAWNIRSAEFSASGRVGDIISTTFVMALALLVAVALYRGFKIAKKLC